MGIVRGDSDQVATLELADGWRRLDDISWRASSWGLRRMVTGGLVLVSLSGEERKTRELPAGGMALRIKHVGQYGAHAAGKNAGFQTDDVLVSYDGRTDLMTDSDVLRYGVTARQSGDVVAVEILRGSERKTLKLPMQE